MFSLDSCSRRHEVAKPTFTRSFGRGVQDSSRRATIAYAPNQ